MKYIKISSTIIPFNNQISEQRKNDVMSIPPRSEMIVKVQVDGQNKEGIIETWVTAGNGCIPKALLAADENKIAICSLINLNDTKVEIARP